MKQLIEKLVRQIGSYQQEEGSSASTHEVTGASKPGHSGAETYLYKHLLPKVELIKFDGQDLTDSMAYYRFRTQFMEVVVRRMNLSGAVKLTFLKNNLLGIALQAIAHFSTEDKNFDLALNTLDELYFDKNKIVNGLMKKFREAKPSKNDKTDNSYSNIVKYISDVKGIISDLDTLGIDCINNEVANKIYAQIVFENLPYTVKSELIIKINTNYPDLKQIFDNYASVLNKLKLKYVNKDHKIDHQNSANSFPSNINLVTSKGQKKSDVKTNQRQAVKTKAATGTHAPSFQPAKSKITTKNDDSKSEDTASQQKRCRLCSQEGHSSFSCTVYPTLEDRKGRLQVLNWCQRCMSTKHLLDQCVGELRYCCFVCNSNHHIAPLCPKLCKQK